jgi:hypothetical protein
MLWQISYHPFFNVCASDWWSIQLIEQRENVKGMRFDGGGVSSKNKYGVSLLTNKKRPDRDGKNASLDEPIKV